MVYRSTCVKETKYSQFFDGVKKDTVFLLLEDDAKKAWLQEIEANSSSYFDVSDNCWIVTCKSNSIGNWIDSYNSNDNYIVENILRKNLDWQDNSVVNFFSKKNIVFKTRWSDFLRLWDEFIAFDDDCPILLPEGLLEKQAILFRPIGDIVKIG